MSTPQDFILQVLGAIDYEGDKKAFSGEFMQGVQLYSFLELAESLPEKEQEEIKDKLTAKGSNNALEIAQILSKHFSKSQILSAHEKAAKDYFSEYLKAIDKTLSQEQRRRLTDVFKEYKKKFSKKK